MSLRFNTSTTEVMSSETNSRESVSESHETEPALDMSTETEGN